MRLLKFLLALVLTFLVTWQLSITHKAGEISLPAFGHFLNPFSGFWQNAESAAAWHGQQQHKIPGLKGKVEILYDDILTPHIFAENMVDAVRAQGYVTASQRLWQMDITVRKAGGRLSEVLGTRTLDIDRRARRRGMVFAAENSLLGLKKQPQTFELLQAYTDGVNAYIDGLSAAQYPIEFKLLGYAPEHWSVLKTALVLETMADMLAGGDSDLSATNALSIFGRPAFDSLYPREIPKQIPVIPDTGQWKKIRPVPFPIKPINADLSMQLESFNDDDHSLLSEGPDGYLRGSNNWAIDGSKSKSGHPILANDPHLNLTLPSIWFQIQIHTPEMNCYGVSLPGIPSIVIGFNDQIAWGVTNVSHDVADWFKISWENPEHTKYRMDGLVNEVKKVIEKIEIRGAVPLMDTVKYTFFGPIVYDYDPKSQLHDCAYKWVSHDVPKENLIEGFLQLNAGKNWNDYKSGISGFDCPAQNFVFASQSGDIGLQVQGRFPLRDNEQGRFVLDGRRSIHAWQGYIPEEEVPSMKNPSRGFVFSANQVSTPSTYPYYYLGNFDAYRGRRANQLLTTLQHATVDSFKNMQLDNYSTRAADALPAMLKLLDYKQLDADGQQMVAAMSTWKYHFDADKIAPTFFDVWWDSTYVNVWDEIKTIQKSGKEIKLPDPWRTIQMLEQDTLNRFFDHPNTPAHETARQIVTESFLKMEKYFQDNPTRKTNWGNFHALDIKHIASLEGFGRLKIPMGGHKTALNAVGISNGPSWRMIISMDDKVRGLGVFPGGQSGNPGSRFYDNMVDTWVNGQYNELLFMQTTADAPERIITKLTLTAQ
jgi:penicillin amidase